MIPLPPRLLPIIMDVSPAGSFGWRSNGRVAMRKKAQHLRSGDRIKLAGKSYTVRCTRNLIQDIGSCVVVDVSTMTDHLAYEIPWDYKIRCISPLVSMQGASISDNARSGV